MCGHDDRGGRGLHVIWNGVLQHGKILSHPGSGGLVLLADVLSPIQEFFSSNFDSDGIMVMFIFQTQKIDGDHRWGQELWVVYCRYKWMK